MRMIIGVVCGLMVWQMAGCNCPKQRSLVRDCELGDDGQLKYEGWLYSAQLSDEEWGKKSAFDLASEAGSSLPSVAEVESALRGYL